MTPGSGSRMTLLALKPSEPPWLYCTSGLIPDLGATPRAVWDIFRAAAQRR
jgi:hypothetical protein